VVSIRVTLRGRVQGVGFRDWLVRQANKAALDGWVRNRPDGAVEALLAGPPDAVAAVLSACRRGPPLARVDEVIEALAEAPAEPGFHRLP
jgi:acylphosphatase